MEFITDGMLGKLTRWLRLAGQNVICVNDYDLQPEEEDEFLLDRAEKDSRILITRDKELHRRAFKRNLESILLEEEEIPKQMFEVSKSLGKEIEIELDFSRCPVCNGEIEPVDKEEVEEDVPGPVLEENQRFWKCESCGKVYWPGSHWEKIEETAKKFQKLKE